MPKYKFIGMSWDTFDSIRFSDPQRYFEAEQPYRVGNGDHYDYGWSPDGIGFYWYDTWNELVAAHGEG
jgi:hypothetical protein